MGVFIYVVLGVKVVYKTADIPRHMLGRVA